MNVKVSVVGANSSEASGTHNRQFTLPLRDGTERIIPGEISILIVLFNYKACSYALHTLTTLRITTKNGGT